MVKRTFDILLLIFSHLLLFPFWLILWVAIPLAIWIQDRGPIFYSQARTGKNGKQFKVLKFRTMIVDAHNVGPVWTHDRDTRITRVGGILRKTALDELPQLLSIWRGDMSFVGPRALAVKEQEYLEKQICKFGERLKVTPGLTGLAQLYDHADDSREKLRYDLEYIRNQSLVLDIKIIVLSILNTATGRWDARMGKSVHDKTTDSRL